MKSVDFQVDPSLPLGPQLAQIPEEHLERILQQSNDWMQYSSGQQMIDGVFQEMKEIAVLPSEVPKDVNPLIKVDFPKEGGVLTWMKNFEHPYRGFPHHQFVEKIDLVKKISRSFASGLYHQLKYRNKLWFLTLLPSLWAAKDALRAGIYAVYRVIERFRIKEIRYCLFIRELHRAFSLKNPKEKVRDAEFREILRDLVCMLLELDNAYRYRAQDILVELDKENLKRRPVRELTRLLTLMQGRESEQQVIDTWKLVKYLVAFYLRIDRKFLKAIVDTLLELDLAKVRFTIEDKVFCIPRKDYKFGFMQNPTEEDIKIVKKHALYEKYTEESANIRKESDIAHKDFKGTREQLIELDKKYDNLLKEAEERYAQERAKI